MKKILVALSVTLFSAGFYSCERKGESVDSGGRKGLIENTSSAESEAEHVAAVTKIQFEKPEHNFGKVVAGEKVQHTFKFTNTGDQPLIIQSASASCGCTVPQKPDKPIAPGESGEIKVEFDSQGRTGAQNKTVTVRANTQENAHVLTLTGEVLDATNGPVK